MPMDRRVFLKTAAWGFSVPFLASRGLSRNLAFSTELFSGTAKGGLLSHFSTPANIKDLQGEEQARLDELWQANLDAFTQQAICGNPWNKSGMANETYYYDPTRTLTPDGTQPTLVSWNAFPNRINQYFGAATALPLNPHNLPQNAVWELADSSFYTDKYGKKQSFPLVPKKLCPQADWRGALHPFGPYGPRGWQDEYCEWNVTRNSQGKIARVDFVCENPEYWHALWRVSPGRVAQLYQDTLNFGLPKGSSNAVTVTVEDLQLVDPTTGKPVTDPSTGSPAYNPLNKWNRGPVALRSGANASGGAMHLTSTPNTLQTELVSLAAVATVLREMGNNDSQELGCCSQDILPYRNSDPHIAQTINQLAASGPTGSMVSVANPVGLYIQKPYFGGYALPEDPRLPKGATVADCWQIVRGSETLMDPVSGKIFPGNFILHAVFQIPASWIEAGVSFTIGDITIKHNGVATPIQYGAQIAETFQIGLFAWRIPAKAPEPPQACVEDLKTPQAQPIQLMYESLWNACYNTPVGNSVGVPMNLASNSVIIPAQVQRGATDLSMALVCHTVTLGPNGELPIVTVPESDITIKATSIKNIIYAQPGHSFPAECQLLTLKVDVSKSARPGLREIVVTNFGQSQGIPGPAFLHVVPGKSEGGTAR
jgi:hypothetical protein